MRQWTAAIDVEAPTEQVWDLIARFEHWPKWGLSVLDVDPRYGRVEPGGRGRVRSVIGVWLPFEITTVSAGSSWDWNVAGVQATGHRVEPIGRGCRVTFAAPGWAPFYRPVMSISLRRLRRLAER